MAGWLVAVQPWKAGTVDKMLSSYSGISDLRLSATGIAFVTGSGFSIPAIRKPGIFASDGVVSSP